MAPTGIHGAPTPTGAWGGPSAPTLAGRAAVRLGQRGQHERERREQHAAERHERVVAERGLCRGGGRRGTHTHNTRGCKRQLVTVLHTYPRRATRPGNTGSPIAHMQTTPRH